MESRSTDPPEEYSRPDYQISLDLDDLAAAHETSRAALDAGDYYIASRMAALENDPGTLGAALIMCGSVDHGLEVLAGLEAKNGSVDLYHAFGLWCRDKRVEAGKILSQTPPGPDAERAKKLAAFIGKPDTHILIVHGPHTARGAIKDIGDGFQIEAISVGRAEKPVSLSALAERGFVPDAVVVLDIYGNRLPQDLFTAGHPVIFWSYDNFYHLARQNADLIRADAVIVNSAFEHSVLRRLCPGRVAAFAGHDVYKDHGGLADPGTVKDIDILHTGLSFTPLMLDKAQFLYRLATLDGADLEIQIHHGFLEEAQYRDVVTRAKMVPNILNRFHGGCPSRSLDALRAGSRVIHPGNFFADDLLGRAGRLVAHVEPATLEQDLIRYLSAETDYDDFQGARVDMEQTFWQSPVRESRFLKYCLFQTVLGEERRPGIPVAGAQTAASARCLSLFEMLLDTPLDESLRNKVGGIFKTSIQDFPDSLLLQFNHGRLLWLLEDRPAAREAFTQVLRLAEGGSFDPTQEDIRLQLYKPAQEMTPYQDYYAALAKDVRLGRADEAPTARRVIAATAHCYLGLDNLQSDQLEGGIEHLCQAMKLCARHFPAARLLVKALHVAGGEPKEVAAAFHDAVNLYPPNISELLPIGIQASEDAHGSEATLGLVRDWAYFITRVHWEKPGDHPIGEQTWQAAEAYFDRLPQPLAGRIRSRYDQRLAKTG